MTDLVPMNDVVDGEIIESSTAIVERGLDDVQLHLVDSFEEISELFRWLGTRDAQDGLAFDVESTGLVAGKDWVKLGQLGGRVHGWSIPWHLYAGVFHDAVKRFEGRLIGHNAKFDYRMLKHDRAAPITLPTSRIHDSMTLSHILEPHMSKGLKPQAARHVDAAAAGLQVAFQGTAWTWETVPWDYAPYWQYGALDTVLTRHLFDHHYPLVNATAPRSYELELAVTWVIAKMEDYGAHIDVPYAREQHERFTRFVEESGQWIEREYGVKPGSNAAIIKILQDFGYQFSKTTASGAVALDKEVLGDIDHPLASTVLARRQLQKLATTYLRHFITEVDEFDIIHPSINPLGARTSRMSMSSPNLQNLPRKSERNAFAEVIRNCFAARHGHTMLFCDFDQIEMRLMAHLSRCVPMIEAFHSDTDFFVALARQIFGDDTIEKKDPRRQITKNAGYATIYAAGIRKFAKTAGVSESTARSFFARWNELYPEVGNFQRYVINTASSRYESEGVPYVTSPLTGRRHVGDTSKMYALVNFLIQGTAAETFKTKLLQLDAIGLGDYMVVPVHDEIILDVPNEVLLDVAHDLQSVMNDNTLFDVPITASVTYGERWGAKKDWNELALTS